VSLVPEEPMMTESYYFYSAFVAVIVVNSNAVLEVADRIVLVSETVAIDGTVIVVVVVVDCLN
jgi:hypothetical protein